MKFLLVKLFRIFLHLQKANFLPSQTAPDLSFFSLIQCFKPYFALQKQFAFYRRGAFPRRRLLGRLRKLEVYRQRITLL